MDTNEILHALTDPDGPLPRAALEAAGERREEMVPIFLKEIEDYIARDPAEREQPSPLFFIFHLLGEWREHAAYRPLARLLRCPDEDIEFLLGDATTTTAHRVMAGVYDDDPQPLYDIVLDGEANEFVRSRMCEALAMVVARGELDRAEVERFLRDAFTHFVSQPCNFVWNGWQSAIALVGLADLRDLVKTAFDDELIDPVWLSFDDFESDLRFGIDHPGEERDRNHGEYTLFGNTIEELSVWHGFRPETDQERQWRERQLAALEEQRRRMSWETAPGQPYVNPHKGVGRNDPCPCGSGKKFKKCCLRRQPDAQPA